MRWDPNRPIGLFAGVPQAEVTAIMQGVFTEAWEAPQGDLATDTTLHLIEHGEVEITLPVGQGIRNVPVLLRLEKGHFFGETRLLFPEPLSRARVASRAGAGGRLLRVGDTEDGPGTLERLIGAHPRVGANLVGEMARRLLAASRFVPSHAAPLRLGYFLLGATAESPTLEVESVPALASQLGLSAPAVTHALSALEGAGLIAVERRNAVHFDVTNRVALANYLGVEDTGAAEVERGPA
ncbi:MAG TPA: hypothetical protein VHB30_13335 [Solirubrobacteraceae bacterium]|nr:hypothetical protein [Solirubrobacteraceae bacterium]